METIIRTSVFDKINLERKRQLDMWGIQNHSDPKWMLILQEELGEAAKEFLEQKENLAVDELIQCAAVIVAWLEQKERSKYSNTEKLS